MVDAAFVIPGDINLPTGGYSYDRRVLALLPQYGVRTSHVVLPGSFPTPSGADMAETERRLAAVPQGTILLIDGLAYGAMSSEAVARIRSPIVALVHHPLCLEAGLTPQRQRRLRELEAAALTFARHVVVTSPTTAQTLAADFGVPREKITVAVPGTDPAQRACGTSKPLQLLAVGSIVPRKAFHILVRALGPLKDRDWRLSIVGPANRDSEALGALEAAIADTGLASRITLVGPVDADSLAGHYATADLFVMPSLYEGYGMVLAEALARGLAIVCTTGGAAAETVPDDAAIKVAPGDERALSQAIGRMLDDAALRRRLADAAWAGGQKLPRWQDTARIVAGVIKDIALMSTPVSAT